MEVLKYMHFYLDCETIRFRGKYKTGGNINSFVFDKEWLVNAEHYLKEFIPVMRRIKYITPLELEHLNFQGDLKNMENVRLDVHSFTFLLKQGFWLFGDEYFDKGLIIDARVHKTD